MRDILLFTAVGILSSVGPIGRLLAVWQPAFGQGESVRVLERMSRGTRI